MNRNLLCTIYLLIAISTVHSASYFYRAGREVIVPTLEEVKEVISELKKEEPVVLEEIITSPVGAGPESLVGVIENIENNVVADAEPLAIKTTVVSDEGRAKPAPVLRLDTLEVISGDKSDKVITVAETVKNAAVQAIEKQNEENESAKPVEILPKVTETKVIDADAVKSVDEPVVPVEKVDAVVKSPESVAPVVKDESVVEPAVEVKKVDAVVENAEKVEKIEKVEETVRSADSEPVKPDDVQEEKEVVVIDEADTVEKAAPKPSSSDKQKQKEKPKEKPSQQKEKPERQQVAAPAPPAPVPGAPNPLNQIQSALNQFTNNIQQAITNVINNTPFGNRPQSDSVVPVAGPALTTAPIALLNTAEIAPAVADPTQAAPTVGGVTNPPNFIQNVQNAIGGAFTSIFPRPTTPPTVAPIAPSATGTRVGEPAAQDAAQAAAVTNPPNFFQNVQHAIGGAFTNLLNPLRPTVAPTAAADVPLPSAEEPTVIKGTRVGDDETVEVVENIEIVNDKVDLGESKVAPAPVAVPVVDVTPDAVSVPVPAPAPVPAVAVPASTQ